MAIIDTGPLVKLGTLTSGGGLSAALDADISTSGYAEAPQGWVGASLGVPSAIQKVSLTPPILGFDSSGLTTPVTMILYGKVGSAPINADDGIALGSTSFTDVNEQREVEIYSYDTTTLWNHVWVKITTGVWTATAAVLFSSPPDLAVYPVGNERTIFASSLERAIPLPQTALEIPDYRITFQTSSQRTASIDYHSDFMHIGSEATYTGVIGMAVRVLYRYGATQEAMLAAGFNDVPNAVGGANIINRDPHHYGNKTLCVGMLLQAGFHQFSINSSAHTTGSPLNGLGQLHPNYNLFRISVEEYGTKYFKVN